MEDFFAKLSIMLVPALLAITAHEVAHGLVADHFGDPTARLLGRLTINPIKHLDLVGTITLLIFGFGWAKPVPVTFSNLRNPRRDMILVALGGPIANLMLATLCALGLHLLGMLSLQSRSLEAISLMLGFGLYINLLLALFNLLPIPPLDGGRVLMGLLPHRQAYALSRIEPFGFLLVIVLIYFTGLWKAVIAPIVNFLLVIFAGQQVVVVEQAMRFLFGR